ncbi:MAG: choice-of-anchor X domain-containing protein [Fimbriimonadales bacterium]
MVRLEVQARLQEPVARVFITAIIYNARDELIQRVSLRDDGKYGDTVAGDRVFTGTYTPASAELHRLRFKMEWEQGRAPQSYYSPFQQFEVIRVPYARFLNKLEQDGVRVGAVARQPVALVIGDAESRYTGATENLALEARCEPAAQVELPSSLAPQSSVAYRFSKPGTYTLYVNTALTYKGQRITTEPDQMMVQYLLPNIGWAVVGGLALIIGLLIPGKRIPLYTHELCLINPSYNTRNSISLDSDARTTIGAADSDYPLTNYTDAPVVLQARAGQKQVYLVEGELRNLLDNEPLPAGSTLVEGEKYRLANGFMLEYKEATYQGDRHTNRFLPNTPLKAFLVGGGAVLLAWYGYQYYQLQQLAQL